MALTERSENDKIEVVGPYKHVQVRRADIIEKDGVEIARTYHRHSLQCGSLGVGVTTLVNTDISGEDADIQAICNAAWTDEVKEAWRVRLVADSGTPVGLGTTS